jgi:hypothetical protein
MYMVWMKFEMCRPWALANEYPKVPMPQTRTSAGKTTEENTPFCLEGSLTCPRRSSQYPIKYHKPATKSDGSSQITALGATGRSRA